MKIVIDIPNFIYKTLIETGKYGFYRFDAKRAIKNGISFDNTFDKLRAELHATAELHFDGDCYLRDEWIDEIFDKYKAESGG